MPPPDVPVYCLNWNFTGIQYFLAGAIRSGADQEDEDDVSTNGVWFGCETVPTPGGLCEVRNPSLLGTLLTFWC